MQSCRIVTATDGQQAYEKAEETPPESDRMRSESGFEDVRLVQKDERQRRTRPASPSFCCYPRPKRMVRSRAMTAERISACRSLSRPKRLASIVENRLEKRLQKEKISQTVAEEKPESPDRNDLHPLDQKFMEKLYKFIEENLSDQDLSVNTLGKNLGFSRTSFYRKIKQLTGQTPNDFLRIYRLNRSAELSPRTVSAERNRRDDRVRNALPFLDLLQKTLRNQSEKFQIASAHRNGTGSAHLQSSPVSVKESRA